MSTTGIEQIPVDLYGHFAVFPAEYRKWFIAEQKRWDGIERSYETEQVKFYRRLNKQFCGVGFGAFLTLRKKNPAFDFRVVANHSALAFEPLRLRELPGLTLRPQQRIGFEKLDDKRGGGEQLATAAGKTEFMLTLANSARVQHNVLILEPTRYLINQTIRRAEKYELEVTPYLRTRLKRFSRWSSIGNVFIGSPLAIVNDAMTGQNSMLRNTIGTLLTDEGQKLRAETWNAILLALPNLCRSFAFSATLTQVKRFAYFSKIPLSDALIYAASGPVLYVCTPEDVDAYVDRPNVITIQQSLWKKFARKHDMDPLTGDWRTIRDAMVLNRRRIAFIAKIIRLLESMNRTSYIPIAERELAESVMNAAGLSSVACCFGGEDNFSLDEKFSNDELAAAVDARKVRHVIGTSHADIGINLPSLTTLLLTEGQSFESSIQRAGRIVRPDPVHKSVVVNLCDGGLRLTEKHAKRRATAILEEHKTTHHLVTTLDELHRALKEETLGSI